MPASQDLAGNGLLTPLLGSPAVAAIFADGARLQAMLDVEAALAAAQARLGIIPRATAAAIAGQCRAEAFDAGGLAAAAAFAGNLAIPLVKALTERVAAQDPEAARFVHWGATSQDIIDTGLVLQLRSALAFIEPELARLAEVLRRLAATHRDTLQAGRTWLQHALPITFGLKAAGWLDAIDRHRARLTELRPRLLVVQLGGAAGTLAALGAQGLAVAAALAEELGLGLPALPWHSERDRLGELAAVSGLLVGTLGKVARDLGLMMQTEVGEAFEPAGAGRGGSSTMPQKRNPVAVAGILAAAVRAPGLVATMITAMGQEHERGLGNWPAEWVTLPELVALAAGAVTRTADLLSGLELDTARMRRNLEATRGLVMAEAVSMALAAHLGRAAAHERVAEACRRALREERSLRDVLLEEPEVVAALGEDGLAHALDPANYLGAAGALIDQVLGLSGKK